MLATAFEEERPMTKADLQNLREQLVRQSYLLSDSWSPTATPLTDLGTDLDKQDLSLWSLEHKQRRLMEIAQALQRLEEGTFGRCEGCRRVIPLERLRALPFTRHCIHCARTAEKEEADALSR